MVNQLPCILRLRSERRRELRHFLEASATEYALATQPAVTQVWPTRAVWATAAWARQVLVRHDHNLVATNDPLATAPTTTLLHVQLGIRHAKAWHARPLRSRPKWRPVKVEYPSVFADPALTADAICRDVRLERVLAHVQVRPLRVEVFALEAKTHLLDTADVADLGVVEDIDPVGVLQLGLALLRRYARHGTCSA